MEIYESTSTCKLHWCYKTCNKDGTCKKDGKCDRINYSSQAQFGLCLDNNDNRIPNVGNFCDISKSCSSCTSVNKRAKICK